MYLCSVIAKLKGKIMETRTTRRVVEVTDTPLDLVAGRNIIRRVEKILMPNGRYRYPVTYIDKTSGFWFGSVIEESERKAKELDVNFRP